jgi:DNA-3-methyladenine glycosylase
LVVAPELLGKYIVFQSESGKKTVRIVEVEAYRQNDPACHAFRGLTKRNEVLFGKPGYSYVYFIYGMHYCLNFVTEPKGSAAAVLIRAAEPAEGWEKEQDKSAQNGLKTLLIGPGRLCRAFGITREHNRLDLTKKVLYVEDRNKPVDRVVRTTRVGIKVGTGLLWRYYDGDSYAISKPH